MDPIAPTFNRKAVRPIECMKAGWQLIKEQYWLFLGISFVGIMVGSLAPMGILIGPAMCGIYLCLFRRAHGQTVTFDMLFKGFNYFVPSLIATLIMMVPMLLFMIPAYIAFFAGMFAILPQGPQPRGQPPDMSFLGPFFALMGGFMLVMIVISTLIGAFFMFTFPLIVDRELSGVDAVKLSFRAVFANFGGVFGLVILNALLGTAGLCACYVGAFLLLPINFAAIAVAYRQVFPELESAPPDLPPEEGIVEGKPNW